MWNSIVAEAWRQESARNAFTLASRENINATAIPASERRLTTAAIDAVVPIPYGRTHTRALLANVLVLNGYWVFWIIWGRGPVSSYTVTIDDQPVPAGVTVTNYTGAAGQSVNATLVSAFAAVSGMPAFTDALPGIAYSVIVASPDAFASPPQFNAHGDWKLVYDPRLDSTNGGSGSQRADTASTWTFSRNPTLILVDFLRSTTYGDGRTPDWPSVIACANANDAVVGIAPNAEVARYCDIVLERESANAQWVETLRTAAACWVVPTGDTFKLIPDVLTEPSATYAHASGNVLAVTRENLPDLSRLPTVMEVVYTAPTVWRDASVLAKRGGVDAGTVPWRKSTVRMPWITRGSQANREAIERLNKLWLRALSLELSIMDEGIAHEPGDVIRLTFPDRGYSSLPLRISSMRPNADGWTLSCGKEDPAVYSGSVVPGPTIGNTPLPLPTSPPAMNAITLAEDIYQVQGAGLFASRISVSWSAVVWPFVAGYLVQITQSGVVQESATVSAGARAYLSRALPENIEYEVSVSVVSTAGMVGAAASANIINNGKQALPSDPGPITAFEVAGEVRLSFVPSTDRDLTGHELRYGATTDTWASATFLDRIAAPATRYATKVIAAGTKRIFIKGLDSVRTERYPAGQESANASYVDVVVTLDTASFLYDFHAFSTTSTLTNAVAQVSAYGVTSWVSDYGQTWSALFTSTLSTYTNALASYASGGTSTLVTAIKDFGTAISGDWLGAMTYTNLTGSATFTLELSNDNFTTYESYPSGSAKVTARYARMRLTGTGVFLVTSLGSVTINTIARSESSLAPVTTNASAGTPVLFTGKYAKYKSAQVTAVGSAAYFGAADRILVNPDVSGALQHQLTVTDSGTSHYDNITFCDNIARVIATGDYLEYDALIPATGQAADPIGGMNVYFTDGSDGASLSLVDTGGYQIFLPQWQSRGLPVRQVWYARKISLASAVGKTTQKFAVSCGNTGGSENNGKFLVACFQNIRITDGAGTTRQQIWSSGEPQANASISSSGVISPQLGQANSMDIYLFNTSGSKVAATATWTFDGV